MKMPHTAEVPDELYEAARVSSIMRGSELGRWRLRHFTVSEDDYARERLRTLVTEAPDQADLSLARQVPPGDYVSLQRRMIDIERREVFEEHIGLTPEEFAHRTDATPDDVLLRYIPDDKAWIPVMSDTPAEILEHADALTHARGRVLITGLGLGCLPHALLSLPDVTRIDIIEIDPEVIALTGPYLDSPRVHIHQGSAADPLKVLRRGQPFDYVWHDIWSHISSRNLEDETAEHGISYQRLFSLYSKHFKVGQQSAWAYEHALEMRRIKQARKIGEREFFHRLLAAPEEQQIQMLVSRVLREKIPGGWPDLPDGDVLPAELRRALDPGGQLEAHIRGRMRDPDFIAGMEKIVSAPLTEDPMGKPNAHLEVE